jgi:cell division protein FtsL
MKKRYFFLYFMVITIPLFLSMIVWQSNRYRNLANEISRMEQIQVEWVESNKRLIASIAEYTSPERIERIAVNEMNLHRTRPEHLLQVRIVEGKGHEY